MLQLVLLYITPLPRSKGVSYYLNGPKFVNTESNRRMYYAKILLDCVKQITNG